MANTRWKAESDVRTLAEAEVIRSDQDRLGRAQTAGVRLQDEEKKEAAAMGKVARGNRARQTRIPHPDGGADIKLGETY